KDDILKYVNGIEPEKKVEMPKDKPKEGKEKADWTLLIGPVQGLGELFKPFLPHSKHGHGHGGGHGHDDHDGDPHIVNKVSVVEDVWKVYNVFKKTNGLIQY